MVLILWTYKITKHYNNRGFSMHTGKPQMALLVAKVPFWEGASKGVLTTCDTQKLCSAENTIFIVFQQTQFCRNRSVSWKNKNWVLFANMQKGVFVLFFLYFWCLVFFALCSCSLFFENAPKRLFSCNSRGLSFFVPPKGMSLKSFSSYSVFFLACLCFPFQKFHLFSLLFVHQALFGKHSFFGFFCFFCLFLC